MAKSYPPNGGYADWVRSNRPELIACLKRLRKGDTLHIHSMGRLARSLDDLRRIVKNLTSEGVIVRFHKEGLSFTGEDSPMSNLLLSMLGAVAEFERSLIKERQREGIAIAKTEGVYKKYQPRSFGPLHCPKHFVV